jgi:hypothetical protein
MLSIDGKRIVLVGIADALADPVGGVVMSLTLPSAPIDLACLAD